MSLGLALGRRVIADLSYSQLADLEILGDAGDERDEAQLMAK